MKTILKKAYLYGRVSNTIQASDGHGLDRQVDAAKKFLEGYPEYIVDETEIIRDAGISAYSGANIADSAGLGGFMNAVREGRIERGSLLVLEAPDRLTRLGIRKGQRLFDELADHGIDIGLVRFGVIIRHDADNDFTSSLIVSIGLYLGHLESKQKSERICATMQKRRNNMRDGHVYASIAAPKWLSIEGDSYVINKSGLAVKEMFNLRLQGYGSVRSARLLNERGFEKHDGGLWKPYNVSHYLRCRTVLGEYQPTKMTKVDGKRVDVPEGSPLVDYYPKLIDHKTFYMVNELLDSGKGGRVEQFSNYLRGLVECPSCGGLTQVKYTKSRGKPYTYFICTSKVINGASSCKSSAFNFKHVTNYVLPVLRQFDYSSLFLDSPVSRSESIQNNKELETLRISLADDKKVVSSLSGASRSAVEGVIYATEKRISELMSQVDSAPSFITQKMVDDSKESIKENPLDTPEKRQEFNSNIKQFIKTIKFEKDTWSVFFKGVEFEVKIPYDIQENTDVLSAIFKHRAELNKPQDDIEKVRQVLAQ